MLGGMFVLALIWSILIVSWFWVVCLALGILMVPYSSWMEFRSLLPWLRGSLTVTLFFLEVQITKRYFSIFRPERACQFVPGLR